MDKVKENKYTIISIAAATVAFGYLVFRVTRPEEDRPFAQKCMPRSEIDALHKSLSASDLQSEKDTFQNVQEAEVFEALNSDVKKHKFYKNAEFRAASSKLVDSPDTIFGKRPSDFLPDLHSTVKKYTHGWDQKNNRGEYHGVYWDL